MSRWIKRAVVVIGVLVLIGAAIAWFLNRIERQTVSEKPSCPSLLRDPNSLTRL